MLMIPNENDMQCIKPFLIWHFIMKSTVDLENLVQPAEVLRRKNHKVVLRSGTPDELLFIHVSPFQEIQSQRYENNIALLDATYKTSKYALSLFFVSVKTNAGYKVLATFTTEEETTAAISEALQHVYDFFAVSTTKPLDNLLFCARVEGSWKRYLKVGFRFQWHNILFHKNFKTNHSNIFGLRAFIAYSRAQLEVCDSLNTPLCSIANNMNADINWFIRQCIGYIICVSTTCIYIYNLEGGK